MNGNVDLLDTELMSNEAIKNINNLMYLHIQIYYQTFVLWMAI